MTLFCQCDYQILDSYSSLLQNILFFPGVCTVIYETHIGCFGSHPDPKYEEFILAVHDLFDVVMDLFFQIPLVEKVYETEPTKVFRKAMDCIYNISDEVIERKIKSYKTAGGAAQLNEDTAKEFIPYLYYVHEMSLAEIKSTIASLMMAAVDTVSSVELRATSFPFVLVVSLLFEKH